MKWPVKVLGTSQNKGTVITTAPAAVFAGRIPQLQGEFPPEKT